MMLKQNIIVFVPQAGLCNRMRSIASAVNLSVHLDRNLEIIWLTDNYLNCPFNYLFRPLPSIRVIHPSKITKYFYMEKKDITPKIRNRFKKLAVIGSSWIYQNIMHDTIMRNPDFYDVKSIDIVEKIAVTKRPLLMTWRSFYSNLKNNSYSFFQPIDELENKINERTADFTDSTIGIHLRRSDNEKSILNSPLSLFESAISDEIEMNPKVNFYLASDSREEKQYLKQVFGSRIITNFEKAERHNIQGMQAALIDLYSLSRTCKIYGSYWSSFSRVAAEISGAELIVLNKSR